MLKLITTEVTLIMPNNRSTKYSLVINASNQYVKDVYNKTKSTRQRFPGKFCELIKLKKMISEMTEKRKLVQNL